MWTRLPLSIQQRLWWAALSCAQALQYLPGVATALIVAMCCYQWDLAWKTVVDTEALDLDLWSVAWTAWVIGTGALLTLLVSVALDAAWLQGWRGPAGWSFSAAGFLISAPDHLLRATSQRRLVASTYAAVAAICVGVLWLTPWATRLTYGAPLMVLSFATAFGSSAVIGFVHDDNEQPDAFLASVSRLTTLGLLATVLWEALYAVAEPQVYTVHWPFSYRNHTSAGSIGLILTVIGFAYVLRHGGQQLELLLWHDRPDGITPWLAPASAERPNPTAVLAGFALLGGWWLTLFSYGNLSTHEQHAAPELPETTLRDQDRWMGALDDRLNAISDGPAIIVALSGGGSRAAVFGRAVMEELTRLNLDEQVVLITGVSGGALATADYWLAADPRHPTPPTTEAWSSMSLPAVEKCLEEYLCKDGQDPTGCVRKERATQLLKSAAIDRMSTQFASGWLRGTLLPDLSRGEALADMWDGLWARHLDVRPGDGSAEDSSPVWGRTSGDAHRPLIVLGAVEATTGRRVAIGFPFLPADLLEQPLDNKYGAIQSGQRAMETIDSLEDLARSGHAGGRHVADLRLTDAVRASSAVPIAIDPVPLDFQPGQPSAALVDGGVFDNTGLDMVASLLFQQKVMDKLQDRDIILIEVDAGAKPGTPDGPDRRASAAQRPSVGRAGPFEALRLGAASLEPAAYQHDRLAADLQIASLVAMVAERGTHRMRYVHVEYDPDRRAAGHTLKAVTTAWALGPSDIARVIAHAALAMDEAKLEDLVQSPNPTPATAPPTTVVSAAPSAMAPGVFASGSMREVAAALIPDAVARPIEDLDCAAREKGGFKILIDNPYKPEAIQLQAKLDAALQASAGFTPLTAAIKQEGFWIVRAKAFHTPTIVLTGGSNKARGADSCADVPGDAQDPSVAPQSAPHAAPPPAAE